MDENQELEKLEKEWKNHFARFTAPEPTREMTLDLIQKIKKIEENQSPVDLRLELETTQNSLSTRDKIVNIFLSQWNFYGTTSWLLTGLVMIAITFTISENTADPLFGFTNWIRWITLLVIAVIGYSFRPKNEGNEIIETLSYYPIIQQMFTRFMIVIGFQLVLALPLCFFIVGRESTILYLVSSFIPVFFFGVVGFVATFWLGQKIGLSLTLFIWFSQVLLKKKLLFQVPGDDYFLVMNTIIFGLSILLLSTILLKSRFSENLK
ncbi:hypothetical protein BACCIP111895_02318 [Neobacillus rhizosphaerae]|uniref:ABC transporter permease n=1 Tax=Neobacillus rhizosphaerae TaxID=2880965 RepID=A0ABM9ER70_9BACI|nr:hypothetical protein [Neobacillus rhizosphaerae]CAH2715134.1 hypothetical protein BACCIP111895_02318 [Neobacillus rhizosphaerae]